MNIPKSEVSRILVITLSNVGDIVLTTPVISALAAEYPGSRIDVMVGPRGKELFERDPAVFKVIIYDKHLPIGEKRRLQLKLKKLRYDLVVDLRNTIFPLLIGPKFRTGTIQHFPKDLIHSSAKHLCRLRSLGIDRVGKSYIHIPREDENSAAALVSGVEGEAGLVVMNPGAKSHLKRWTTDGFARVAERIIGECACGVVLVGAEEDMPTVAKVIAKLSPGASAKVRNLTGRTNVRQLAALIKRARVLITNDSAPLHIACAVGSKVLALFGPTDPQKYGPTGEYDAAISKKLFCAPCEKATCAYHHECMKLIGADEVFEAARMMIEGYG